MTPELAAQHLTNAVSIYRYFILSLHFTHTVFPVSVDPQGRTGRYSGRDMRQHLLQDRRTRCSKTLVAGPNGDSHSDASRKENSSARTLSAHKHIGYGHSKDYALAASNFSRKPSICLADQLRIRLNCKHAAGAMLVEG
jgi:hypothetical protein